MSMDAPSELRFEALLVLLRRQRFAAAIARLLDTFSTSPRWERSEATRTLVQQPSDLEALSRRLEAGTATASDRAALASLPRCHLPPEKLVEIVARLESSV